MLRVNQTMLKTIVPVVDALSPGQRTDLAVFILQMMKRAKGTAGEEEFDLLVNDLRDVMLVHSLRRE